jgi:hypothetical protein
MGFLKRHRKIGFFIVLALTAIGVALAVRNQIGTTNGMTEASAPPAPTATPLSSNASDEPVDPNTLVVYFEPNFLQGKRISRINLGNTDLRSLLFGSLLAQDEKNRSTRPYLAETFETLNDGKIWKFKLQKGVSSSEVKRIYWEFANSDQLFSSGGQFRDLTEIRTPSDREVHFIFSKPVSSAGIFATDVLIFRAEGKSASSLIDYDFLPGYFLLERIDEAGWHLRRNPALKFEGDGDFNSVLLKRAEKSEFLKNRNSPVIAVVNTDDQDLPDLAELKPAAWLQAKTTLLVFNHKSKLLATPQIRETIWKNAVFFMTKERLDSKMNVAFPNFYLTEYTSFKLDVPEQAAKLSLPKTPEVEAYGMWRGKEKAYLERFITNLLGKNSTIRFIDDGTMFPGFRKSKADLVLQQIPRIGRYSDSKAFVKFCSSYAALPDSSGKLCELIKSESTREEKASRFQQLLLDQREILPLFHFLPRIYKSEGIDIHPSAYGIDQIRFAKKSKPR